VERHLTGTENESWEMLYLKVYKSQLAVLEQALEIASLMFGGQKARSYAFETICADFLAGAYLDASGHADSLRLALTRIYLLLPNPERQEFLLRIPKASRILASQDNPGFAWTGTLINSFARKCWSAMAGDANDAEVPKICRSSTCNRAAFREAMWKKISSPFVVGAIEKSASAPRLPHGSTCDWVNYALQQKS
jgi:hypothetical protein